MTATPLSPEERLDIERTTEYYSGEMCEISAAKAPHSVIAANITAGLHRQLRHGPCLLFTSGMGVHAREGDLFAYPDVTVACGEPQYLGVQDTLLNPTLIVEVLSPSTELLDRSRKFKSYRSIESLREYLMVSSEEAVAELWTKLPDGKWPLTEADALEDSVELQSIGARLKLADVYEKAL